MIIMKVPKKSWYWNLNQRFDKTFEIMFDLSNWLIGFNWNKATHEIEGLSYFSFHLFCFHFCYSWN